MLQPRRSEHELPARLRVCQVDYCALTGAGGGEPFAEEHVPAELQGVGEQGRGGVVAQLRPVTYEVAANVGAEQVHRADVGAGVAVDSCSVQAEHAAGEAGEIQGCLGWMFDPSQPDSCSRPVLYVHRADQIALASWCVWGLDAMADNGYLYS